MDTGKADVDIEEDLPAGVCTMASIKQSQSSSTETSCVDGAKAENQCITFGHETSPSGTADSLSSENVKDVQNAECGKEVIIPVTDHENVEDVTSDTTPKDLYVVRNSISITGPMNGDANPGYTNIRNGSPSNSRSDAGAGLLEQNGEVLAGVNDKENGIMSTSVEQFRDDENSLTSLERDEEVLADVNDKVDGITTTSVEQSRYDDNSLTSSLPETRSGSLKSDEATAKEIVTEAAEQDPVLVASEGIHIPGPVCSSLHEKMLPTDQDLKSLPVEALSREVQRSGSDSVSAEGKDDSNAIEPSSVIAVVQEAEINTRKGVQLEFDLNDEFWFEEVDPSAVPNEESNCDKADHHLIDQTTIVAAAVSSSRASVVPELPAGRLQFEGTLGWKGSTKTDAFCPASRRSPLENDIVTSSTGLSSSMKQSAHDFDLNMADDEVDANPDKKLDYLIPVSSSHPSEESCVEIGPRKLERKEFDLNSHGEAPSPACWSKNGLPFDQMNTHRSPSPTSSSSSVHPSVWDVDLNKKYLVPNVPSDPQHLANLSFNLGDPYRVMKPANSAISIMGTRVDVGMNDSLLQSPLHPNWNVTGLGNLLPASLNPSPPLQSFVYSPGIPISTVDSRDSPVLPHMMSPAQPPYLMNMMGSSPVLNGFGSSYCSSFDLNTDAGKRDEPHARQYLMSSQGGFPEPLSLAVSQGSSCLQKRKEPHSGWDMYQHGLKHHEAPPNT